jgi:hypothetical protein
LIVGLVVGGMWGWVASLPHRWRARKLHKEVGRLNEHIGTLQQPVVGEPMPPKKRFWEKP